MTVFSISSSSWLTATLCFFYFLKIIPSRPGVLMNIRSKMKALAWRLILMVEAVSIGGSFLSIIISLQNANEKNSTTNVVKPMDGHMRHTLKLSYIVLMLSSLPMVVIIMTMVASAWFLKQHNCQMKRNNGSLVNANVRDYQSVIQNMMGLLIFYLLVFLAIILLTLEIFDAGSGGYWLCAMSLLSFPTGQSALLIYSNPKLMQILKELFLALTCRVSGD
ncbi:taste receptor type 2 member 40-like [Rhinoderma darwinii]|uniref:taste receptor type 2 member 40-like n=1 Tax=Rhinoderma darwinii TaxID=43563 RepID=UPI003F681370